MCILKYAQRIAIKNKVLKNKRMGHIFFVRMDVFFKQNVTGFYSDT